MWSGNYFQVLFDFQRILYKKESGALYADLDKFWSFCCYISSISSLIPKFHCPIEVVLKAQTQVSGASVQVAVFCRVFLFLSFVMT